MPCRERRPEGSVVSENQREQEHQRGGRGREEAQRTQRKVLGSSGEPAGSAPRGKPVECSVNKCVSEAVGEFLVGCIPRLSSVEDMVYAGPCFCVQWSNTDAV